MAPTTRASRPVKPEVDTVDNVLEKLAQTAKFDCDWPTLRHHFYLALLAALPLFLELGPPVSLAGRVPVVAAESTPPRTGPRPGPSGASSGSASSDALLLSPGRGGWSDGEGSGGLTPPRDDAADASLRPSTQGGLVILPFPPLDSGRRRRSMSGEQPRVNGGTPSARGNPFDEEWDEEVIIGGRKLTAYLDEEDGKKEVAKVATRLEELTFAPFTVQRLAELLLAPTKLHTSLGKFLRAIEKMLNVTTAYTPPSYTYVPPTSLPVEALGSASSPRSTSAAASMSGSSEDSTVPPGSMTPMFSPIPFLVHGHDDDLGEAMLDSDGAMEDSLMSPLMLETGSSGAFAGQQAERARSPTPEPEEEASSSGPSAAASSETTSANGNGDSSDPGHQSYLGRVDELDAGPITSNGHAETASTAPDAAGAGSTGGVGEHGAMTPHGMSDRPVPLSSTTVIGESAEADLAEREIAPLPRTASRADVPATAGDEDAEMASAESAEKERDESSVDKADKENEESKEGEGAIEVDEKDGNEDGKKE